MMFSVAFLPHDYYGESDPKNLVPILDGIVRILLLLGFSLFGLLRPGQYKLV
jgi:hypothetical protein